MYTSAMDDFIAAPRPGGQQRITTGSGGGVTALSAKLKGSFIRVKAETSNVDFLLGDEDVAAPTLAATGSGADVGYSLLAGQHVDILITTETHIAWDAAGAGALLLTKGWRQGGAYTK